MKFKDLYQMWCYVQERKKEPASMEDWHGWKEREAALEKKMEKLINTYTEPIEVARVKLSPRERSDSNSSREEY